MIQRMFAAALLLAAPVAAQQSAVTPDQAQSAAAIATAYAAQNPLYACDPSRADGFNPTWYDHARPDVVAAGIDAYTHYQQYGKNEGSAPCQKAVAPADETAAVATLVAYAEQPVAAAPAPVVTPTPTPAPTATSTPTLINGVDYAYYLTANPDVAAAGLDPAQHYAQFGKWEGRLPYAGAKPWRPSSPTDYEGAPACQVQVLDTWAPAGAAQVRVRFKLTRFGDGTPCERSYSMQGTVGNPSDMSAQLDGVGSLNITGQTTPIAVGEALTLPSTGSQGEVVFNIPPFGPGWFNVSLQSAEWNTKATGAAHVIVSATQPAGTAYNPDTLVLPTPTPYPTGLGTPTYATNFLGDLAADGWTYSPGVQLNNMTGVFVDTSATTQSGKAVDVYPIVTDPDGTKVRAITVLDLRGDPVSGKYLYATGAFHRVLGSGRFGYLRSVVAYTAPLPGSDQEQWHLSVDGSWPPELDTQESFVGARGRITETWHPRSGAQTIGFAPLAQIEGKHEWMEQFTSTTYRLWLDQRLVIERPNYGYKETLTTIHSLEAPGGAGGTYDASQPYGGMMIKLYGDTWWDAPATTSIAANDDAAGAKLAS